jgi:hypothetical protein
MDVPTIIREIKALKPADREVVLDALQEMIEWDGMFTAEQLAELDRRVAAFEAGQLETTRWEGAQAGGLAGK